VNVVNLSRGHEEFPERFEEVVIKLDVGLDGVEKNSVTVKNVTVEH